MISAVIFDLDGTLVDSNDLHVQAWQEAFRHFGKEIPVTKLREQIGKGSDQYLPVRFFVTRRTCSNDIISRPSPDESLDWRKRARRSRFLYRDRSSTNELVLRSKVLTIVRTVL